LTVASRVRSPTGSECQIHSTREEPGRDCPRCPRLVAFREAWREKEPDWFNAPVPSFGPADARLLIVGLAPGLRGANRTGRPFTGDYAGDLLYATLKQFGFAKGEYAARPDDGLTLIDCRITNAVRCVPPENKPTPKEIATCRDFLSATLTAMTEVRAIVVLGRIAHETVITAQNAKRSAHPFSHGCAYPMGRATLFASYHCSRYNTSTRVLTPQMFRDVFARVRAHLDALA
jgi:uracil-DNA glycosylase family 4